MGREAQVRKSRTNKETGEVIFGTADHLKDVTHTEERLKALGLVNPNEDRPKLEIFYPDREP